MKWSRLFALGLIGFTACHSGGGDKGDTETQKDTGSDTTDDGQSTGEQDGDSERLGEEASDDDGSDTHNSNSDGESDADSDKDGGGDEGGISPTDTDSDGIWDTQTAEDTERSPDTAPAPVCPDGSVSHTTSVGNTICCSDTYPIFCDANTDGYTGGCWSEGVSCEAIIFCGMQWVACLAGALPYCDQNDDLSCSSCADESRRFETASGRPLCCSEDRPQFCDEDASGYTGGCWPEDIDCDTITVCGDTFTACFEGSLPYCQEEGHLQCYPCPEGSERHVTISGRPVCCSPETPTFCDENDTGYPGGCWGANLSCDTIIECNGVWSACAAGLTSSCEADALICR